MNPERSTPTALCHPPPQVGLCATADFVFDLQPGRRDELMLVVATPGWITGQSYMISAALLSRTPSLLMDGSAVSPPAR